ncbi:MAG: putative metal-dependent hydrolase with the TIM-barrel fold [Frankiales bacterium]|nr:putative metal-dependent hydrolase with the TIM-barrel fold [Frankiales bacterium]
MGSVETIKGAVDDSSLGPVLMHEHVFILSPEADQDYPGQVFWDEEEKIQLAIDKLQRLKAAGVDTIVDLTVLNMGRYLPRLARINEQVDLNIVVASGLYTYDSLPHFLQYRGPGMPIAGPDPMVEMFTKDVQEGIGDTGIKAGIFKCATDVQGLTPGVERVLRAVAQAHRNTGAPISTHTHAESERGTDQQNIFAEEGVDLTRVVIGHSGDSTDLDYLKRVADRGSYLGMDRFGMDVAPFSDFDTRVGVVADLCAAGYADQMVLSHDSICWTDWLPSELSQGTPFDMPNWHLNHISEDVLPALQKRGVTDDQIKTMMVDNPRKILGVEKKSY